MANSCTVWILVLLGLAHELGQGLEAHFCIRRAVARARVGVRGHGDDIPTAVARHRRARAQRALELPVRAAVLQAAQHLAQGDTCHSTPPLTVIDCH